MSNGLWGQTIFGLYEIFANIIPGSILLCTIIYLMEEIGYLVNFYQENILTVNYFVLTMFFFTAFIIGQSIQALASILENRINKWKYNGYPSEQFLKENDCTFPDYFKDNIRSKVNELYSTPIDSSTQHIFDLCYTYVIQKEKSKRAIQFLNMYTFSRNIMVTMIIEAIIFIVMSIIFYSIYLFLFSILTIIFIYALYKRYVTYSESFAKEVYRSFFIDVCNNGG